MKIEKIYLNRDVSNPNVLFLETESADLSKELFIEGYDEDGNLVKYEVSRNAIIFEKGQETLIAPYDRQFDSKPLGSRAMAIFAGPLFNFILAFFIFLAIGLLNGIPTNEPIIKEVVNDSPAYAAGMEAGDFVKEVNGKPIEILAGIHRNDPGKPW